MPLIVWVVYGSVDWFWELPALAGPALGFLGMAMALEPVAARPAASAAAAPRTRASHGPITAPALLTRGLLAAGLVAAIVVLAFPYLSVREVSIADDVQSQNPRAALQHFARAATLNPLSSVPGRLAGAVALTIGDNRTAAQRFRQSLSAQPGGWFAWLGAGLAASALGDRAQARRDFERAYAINSVQPATRQALRRVDSAHPLTSAQAFSLLVTE
jgi:tetratricopeptide (TPR) repeat protein